MDRTIVCIIAITVLILVGAVLLSSQSASTLPTTASDDPNRPIAALSEVNFDFGSVLMSDERTRAVTIRNDGQTSLELSKVKTSCDCTFATIALPSGSTSQEFSMHGSNNWQGKLEAGETATVTVIYRPAIMPVKGKVTRAVSITTNDPNQPSIQIAFQAEVE